MRILVIGGLGFIGAYVTRQLLDDGHTVMVQDVLPTAYSLESHALLGEAIGIRKKTLLRGADFVIGGPHEPNRFGQLVYDFDPEIVIHLVGMPIATAAETHMTEARRQVST